ncbi:SDR family oxidoreductase [Ilumatobacter nonamiensis]|uniref:SDR family oxidoreductase n=1 Tax=Ilumatobacter nonamiensis TaxID=467093 RepID=UPI00034B1BA3|nr:SDR family oxidoreductase [Ilumatobacter nonamiensis]
MTPPVALVTGANRGIGFEVARQLAGLDHHVLLGCRGVDAGTEAERQLRDRGWKASSIELDVADASSVQHAAAEIDRVHGRLDILVNNAGTNFDNDRRAMDVDLAEVRSTLEINLFGAWCVVQTMLPLLRRSDHPRVVNVSSRAGSLSGMEGGAPSYRVSKTALNALTRMMSDELRLDGVLVNSVCPGRSATAMVGFDGRSPDIGASGIVWAATLPDDGPTGGFFRDRERVDW